MRPHKDFAPVVAPDPWLRIAALDVSLALSLRATLALDAGVKAATLSEEMTGWVLHVTFASRADAERLRRDIHHAVREAR